MLRGERPTSPGGARFSLDHASALRLLDLSTDSIAAYRFDSTILYANSATERTFGKARQELIGRRLFELFPDAVGNPFHRTFERVARTGNAETLEHYYAPFDRWFDNEFYVDGEVIWVVARDVTARIQAQRRLQTLAETSQVFATMGRDLRTTLRQLARVAGEALGDASLVRVVSEDGQVLEAVGSWGRTPELERALLQLTPEPVTGAAAGLALASRSLLLGRGEFAAMMERVASEASRHVARQLRPHSLVLAPIRSDDRFLGFLAVVRAEGHSPAPLTQADLGLLEDLASRTALAIVAVRSFSEADRKKDEFLALLGHELRNPLAPIMTALQLMKMRGIEAAAKERGVIERQVLHMMQLVDDLLDTSRIVRGVLTLRLEPVLLSSVVERALEIAGPLLEERRHQLSVSALPPARVNADPTRLAQVFSNLLTNAARYTPPGGKVRVEASVDEGAGEVSISVTDDGMGIPPELRERIFEPFFQAGRPPHAQGGLGLGLPLVRSLTQLHGGAVAVESEGAGRGSRFTVRLPMLRDTVAHSGPTPARIGTGSGAARRILLVDDNEDALQLLAEALRLDGHEVHTAPDGAVALRAMEGTTFDAYILDIGLPVMDGYELARRVRDAHGTGVRLAALTGYGQEKDRERALAAGFDTHFVKPVSLDALREFLR